MSPAEARDALARAFPGMDWAAYSANVRGLVRTVSVVVHPDEFGPGWYALADAGGTLSGRSGADPVAAVTLAMTALRERLQRHLTAQLAALDAATEGAT